MELEVGKMPVEDLKTYCYIQEQTSWPEDYIKKFGFEYHEMGNRFFLTFPAVLQSFDVLNRNRRIYRAENIMERIQNDEYIQSMLRQNSWMGEIDHPASEYAGSELSMNRIANPDPKMTSHFKRKPRLNGNLLEADIQTDSSNENGMNMAIKIVDGKIVPAFSARVLGDLQNRSGKPVVNVRKLICYDWVLFPSHPEALGKITQPMLESADKRVEDVNTKIIFLEHLAKAAANSNAETEWLCESFGLTIDAIKGFTPDGKLVIQENATNVYHQPISDKHIRERTKKSIADWLNA